MTEGAAKKLFAAAGIAGDIRAVARAKDFKAIPLGMNVSLSIHNKLKYAMSHNVIARLKGTTDSGECVIYTAHWDHFGIGKPDAKGDSIYNGAVDNGDGTASLISMAVAMNPSARMISVKTNLPVCASLWLAILAIRPSSKMMTPPTSRS